MKDLENTRKAAIQLINKIITLKTNVASGCPSSREELTIELPRLEKIKIWATKNNQLQEIKHYFTAKTFGQKFQFAASEVATYFHN